MRRRKSRRKGTNASKKGEGGVCVFSFSEKKTNWMMMARRRRRKRRRKRVMRMIMTKEVTDCFDEASDIDDLNPFHV